MLTPTLPLADRAAAHEAAGHWTTDLVDEHLRRFAAADPGRPAVVDRGRTVTYRELDGLIARAAAGLRGLGFARGDVLAWQLPNWLEAVVLHHAALRLGGVSLPLVPIYRERELTFVLRQANARVLVVPALFRSFDYRPMAARLRGALPQLRDVVVVGDDELVPPDAVSYRRLTDGRAEPAAEVDRSARDVALVLYTSGTTADPKGVLHTHQTLEHENRSIIDLWDLGADDCIFMPSPVTHITGVLYGLQLPFMIGSRVVFQDVWNPAEAQRLVAENAATVVIGATPFVHGLLQPLDNGSHDVTSLRVVACGGADVPPELMLRAERELGAIACRIYGSTEYPTVSGANAQDPAERRAYTDGRPIGAAQARVVADDGAEGPAVVGELRVRGPEMFVGYVDAALHAASFDADGWFRTGDAARIDADGAITIVGRIKDIIIRGGENISAREVEDLLFEHPHVVDAAVVGMPDPVLGERVCAYLVVEPGRTLELADVVAFLEERRIARQKLPERVVTVPELTRTASGKVQKFRLREDAARRVEAASVLGAGEGSRR